MIDCYFCAHVYIIVNKVPINNVETALLNCAAVVTAATSRGQISSIPLSDSLTAKSNTITCMLKSIHTKSDILKEP